jgi:hypothetical protein
MGESANHAQVGRSMVAAHAAFILPEAQIQLPVEIVLNAPMASDRFPKLRRCYQTAGECNTGFP